MTSTRRDLETVLAELVATTVRLDRTADPAERAGLRVRLHELRAEAAEMRGPRLSGLSAQALDAALARCNRALDELRSARLDPGMVGGASGYDGGLDPLQTIEHNRALDEAGGRDLLEAERAALLAEIARRRFGS